VSSPSSSSAAPCFVCAKHALGEEAGGGVLYRDELVYAGHVHVAGESAYRGHLVVEPLRHVDGFGLLTDDEAEALGRLANRLADVLRSVLGADHVYVWALGGAAASERTPSHLHVHLVPRYEGTPREYWGALITRWPDAPRVDEPEMRALITVLRTQLSAG
jgi:diadenosine tetraphosphate (Ap4A) HIT family hydrolase